MVGVQDISLLSPEEYFDWEAQQPERYEYVDGVAYAMAGGTLAHADIALKSLQH